MVARELRPCVYVRYVDDFLLFGDDKPALNQARDVIEAKLEPLRLLLHEGKSRVYRCDEGMTFLGWRLFPGRARLVRSNVVQFRRRLRRMQREYGSGARAGGELRDRIRAWLAHTAHGDTSRVREQTLEQFPFRRRCAV
ncbi:MAG: hypothetical protein ACKV22_21605 [Bryobacteraceae bacterium]